jgi:hypothetical protein
MVDLRDRSQREDVRDEIEKSKRIIRDFAREFTATVLKISVDEVDDFIRNECIPASEKVYNNAYFEKVKMKPKIHIWNFDVKTRKWFKVETRRRTEEEMEFEWITG